MGLAFIYQQSEQGVWGLSFHTQKKGAGRGGKALVFKSSNMRSKLKSQGFRLSPCPSPAPGPKPPVAAESLLAYILPW